jgi:WD40 repeat protein
MSAFSNHNILKKVYDNIDMNTNLSLQANIKSKNLLETLIRAINCYKNRYSYMKCITNLENFNSLIYSAEILPNGNIMIGSNDGTIKVYNRRTNYSCIKEFTVHKTAVSTIQTLRNGNIISKSSEAIFLWEPATLRYKKLTGDNENIKALIVLDNGCIVASIGKKLVMWDDDRLVGEIIVESVITQFYLLSNKMLYGDAGLKFYILNYDLCIISKRAKNAICPIVCEGFNQIICCYEKWFIEVLNNNFDVVDKIQVKVNCRGFVMLSENDLIAFAGNELIIWDIANKFKVQTFEYDWNFQKVVPFKDRFFITTSEISKCRLWCYDNKKPKMIKTFRGPKDVINFTKFQDGYFITAYMNYTCRMYKAEY